MPLMHKLLPVILAGFVAGGAFAQTPAPAAPAEPPVAAAHKDVKKAAAPRKPHKVVASKQHKAVKTVAAKKLSKHDSHKS